jgi:predicted CoA-substrate-specific enzyme activase
MAIYAGLDIGSRTTKLAILRDGRFDFRILDTGVKPAETCTRLLDGTRFDAVVSTGYGRHLAKTEFDYPTITEILAAARGARHVLPEARSVIDVGGQDCKAVTLAEDGTFTNFLMNDRCAAGTGRFLEIMASTLQLQLGEFAALALEADSAVEINSMCSVFAESEVVSLIASGADLKQISLGLHRAVVNRVGALLGKIGAQAPIAFIGGVALNPAAVSQLREKLRRDVHVCEFPQFVVAAGAALVAADGTRATPEPPVVAYHHGDPCLRARTRTSAGHEAQGPCE